MCPVSGAADGRDMMEVLVMPVEACWKRRAVDDFWVRRSSTVRYTSLDACMVSESARENGGLRSTKGIAQTSKSDQLGNRGK